ncbi:U-box domain-containing protein 44-like isoform X1 [Pistacia vera]|uniref:U-box domain-containing protein 44-like isoform X1 n=1 Tax=Pistacia vera TaxID=55513 RepID=UPI001263BD59|nr:U-box domain-containing protein 44-like isoform X1 [Pistacia vera]XP_031248728.1 U-box domain-containing protein 44-like isoform X1 [Pistacia vera]
MAKDMIISASLAPMSELLSQTVLAILETVNAAKEVPIQKENFNKFSNYLGMIVSTLKELSKLDIDNSDSSESLRNALGLLNQEIKNARQLTLDCREKNKIYLLINCRKITKHIDGSTKEISQALSLMPLDSLDVSLGLSNKISRLCKNMMDTEYCVALVEEEIYEKIESGIQESDVDRSYANELLAHVCEVVGISTEQSALKKEFEEFKSEIEDARLRIDTAETIKIEQIIALLEKADATTSHEEKQKKYFNERNHLGRQPLEPLQSFYCPITRDVMTDPVESSTGRTFERSAIEKWVAEGNKICPSTYTPLENLDFRPNKTLRQSIQQWKSRNKMSTIVSIKPKLQSNDEREVLQSLGKLQDLCIERESHRDWVTMENYIPILVTLLGAKNRELRTLSLDILCILARDGDENKERIAEVDHALESIVCSLAHQIGESKSALRLLLQLSSISKVQDVIGNVQGCMFLLVAMLNSDDPDASGDAKELLENLSYLDQNAIQMAKANYFKPLLQLLSSGPEHVRLIMAETLSEIELTDHNKLALFREGALGPLLQMLSHSDLEMKIVAVKALKNLSHIPQNGLQMIKEGALKPLFELLYRHGLSSSSFREGVAAIIMHLATATCSQEANDLQISMLESEEDIFKLFSLISLTGPDIQKSILRTFQALCQSPSGPDIRAKLRQLSAAQVLVQLCEVNNHTIRANAVKLFCCLTEDGDGRTFLEHVGQRCIETLLGIIKTSCDVEEIAAAMGIICNLPKNTQMTQWLLDAGALEVIFTCLNDGNRNASYKRPVVENATGALCCFTISTNLEWQKRAAEVGIIPVLVQLLVSGTSLTKQNAAISLKQFSESSTALSQPVRKRGLFFCCMAAPLTGCPVHLGICTVESSFCIVEANALPPLVRMLGETNLGVSEASLDALLTLIDGERLQSSSKVLDEANAIAPIIKLLCSPSASLQEKILKALERLFQLVELKQKYGKSAQVLLVDITQRGNSSMKSLAAKVLVRLNLLEEQSSFFG